MVSYLIKLIPTEDGTEDLLLPLPPELLKSLNWQEGDEIDYQKDGNTIVIEKIKKS